MKTSNGAYGGFGDIEIKASSPDDDWGNDWITDSLCEYANPPFDGQPQDFYVGDEFTWEDNQTMRDGLYETEEECQFAIFDNSDIEQLVDKIKRCLK